MTTVTEKKPACAQKIIHIKAKDLPLSCPTEDMHLWNAHPKVYLPIAKTGKETCPYCGTQYILAPKK
ncbi:MAG: zinc-finger domain-containing protein [Legionellales bacterium]|nr:zinc-finger domain-containing protein [Legionellales bacterium]